MMKSITKLKPITLKLIPIFCLIFYFGVVEKLSFFNDSNKLYILIILNFIALTALILYLKLKEGNKQKIIMLTILGIISSSVIYFAGF